MISRRNDLIFKCPERERRETERERETDLLVSPQKLETDWGAHGAF